MPDAPAIDWSDHTKSDGDVVDIRVPDSFTAMPRIDKFLTQFFPDASRTKIQRSIKKGHAKVNGADVKKSYPVEPGDRIVCRVIEKPPMEAVPQDLPLAVVYEDEDLLVVNKSAGRVVHPAPGHRNGTLVNALLHHVQGERMSKDTPEMSDDDVGLSVVNALPSRPDHPVIRPGIVHRLDKGTTGLLVVAKHDVAHRHLAKQFKAHTIDRQYVALVWGTPDPPEGTITGAIGRDPHHRTRMAVVDAEQGKPATTHYAVEEGLGDVSRVSFTLETGRTHQIRVHAADAGHPLLADDTYGGAHIRYGRQGGKRRTFFDRLFDTLGRPALHAAHLGFTHPMTEERLTFNAPLPDDMQAVWARLCEVVV